MNRLAETLLAIALAGPLALAALGFVIMATLEGECPWTRAQPRNRTP